MRCRESPFDATLGSAVSDATSRMPLSDPSAQASALRGVSGSIESTPSLFGPKRVVS
jgi:hypothetical protein